MEKCPICTAIKENRLSLLYEDDDCLGFLHIAPINYGHCLVVPKAHHVSLTTVPEAIQGKLFTVAAKLAKALSKSIKGNGFNIHYGDHEIAGSALPHCHLHVIPRKAGDGFHWNWRCLDTDDHLNQTIIEKVKNRLTADE